MKQPRRNAGKLFWLLALLVLCTGFAMLAVFQDFRAQMLDLLPFSKTTGPSSEALRETGSTFRSPIRLRFKPESAATQARLQQPKETQDNASADSLETEGNGSAHPSQGGQSGPPGSKSSAAPAQKQGSLPSPQKSNKPSTQPDPESRVFSIQVGACREKLNARYLVEELQAEGYQPVLFRDQHADGEIWYKVRVGEYATQEQAQEALETFRNRQTQDGFLIRITPEAPPHTNK